jgi:ParB family chromosome partitioning protein
MALGRGLESLIPKQQKPQSDAASIGIPEKPIFRPQPQGLVKQESIFYIETEKIKPNPFQPRRDFDEAELVSLADSMKQYGMIQPLLVSKVETEVPSGTKVEYQLIAGERRLRAASIAGLKQVPVIIKNTDDSTKLELALIENVQRQDLNPVEEALAYQRLINEFNMTQIQVAQKVGKSREVIANRVRLLDLPYEVQKNLSDGKITEGHAKVLLSIKNPERQRYLAEETSAKGMSVRDLEEIVKQEESYKVKNTVRTIDPELESYKKTVQEILGTPVAISGSKEKGKLAISFYSEEDLERLIKRLTG